MTESPLADMDSRNNEATVAKDASESRKSVVRRAPPDGVYLPPAKRRQLQQEQAKQAPDPGSLPQQKQSWQDQKRVIHGTINRLNAETIKPLIHDLFSKVNLVRLRGVLAKSILAAAISSPVYSPVYAALVAVLNTKLPEVGELVTARAILAFRKHYRRKEKASCTAVAVFLGHLFHQAVVHELVLLQVLTVLLDGDPTDDSVEVAVQLLTVTGYALLEQSPTGVRAVLERLRALLHEGVLSRRVEVKMEHMLTLRKTGFRDSFPPVPDELDLVDSDDQITFEMDLDDEDLKRQEELDVFRLDPDYKENEQVWSKIRAEVLGLGGSDDESGSGDSETDDSGDGQESEEEDEEEASPETAIVPAAKAGTVVVQDLTEADLVHLRRQIYLTIMSSATYEECAHKLAKIDIPFGREEELINMLIECCSQERTFQRFYGMIAARFCLLEDRWRRAFMEAFTLQYNTIHRLETNKLRNVAKLFAYLLHTDAMPWSVLSSIHLNEDETTSSSRIFLKIVVQEIAEAMGINKLMVRFESEEPELVEWYKGMFPRDNVRNTRYAINFFTSIGLGPLTDGLREYLKNAPKIIMAQAAESALAKKAAEDDDDSSSVSSSSSSSESSLSTSSSSSSSSGSRSSSSSDSRRRGRSKKRRTRRYSSSSSDGGDSRSGRPRSPPPSRKMPSSSRKEFSRASSPTEQSRSTSRKEPLQMSKTSSNTRSRREESERSNSRSPSPVERRSGKDRRRRSLSPRSSHR